MFSASQISAVLIALVGLLLTILNIIDKIIAFKRKADEPFNELEERVVVLESKVKEHDQKLLNGNDHFRELDEALEVINKSTLALIDFEIQYCLTEHKDISDGLKKAHDDLHEFLSKR